MKTRFIKCIGTRVWFRVFCYSSDHGCKNGYGCEAKIFLSDFLHEDKPEEHGIQRGGNTEDYPEERWPRVCEHCNEKFEGKKFHRQVFNKRLYNTASGSPEPGDLYWINWYPETMYWDNHSGPMLCAVLPNGREWIIDSRASNCDKPDDRAHRCWVRHGDPETGLVNVDKNGHTCSAGAGSIIVGDYHGFLRYGNFEAC